ncbi:MAG: SCO6880 family protein, partial [Candidatus Rokuibacteriota bacterium]
MTDAVAGAERNYRFAPLDRSGWILGLGAAQCLGLGGGLALGALLVSAGTPPVVALVPLGVGVAFAFGRWRSRPLHEWAPVLVAWVALPASDRRWRAAVPLVGDTDDRRGPPLPACLAGLELIEVSSPWTRRRRLGSVGVVADARARVFSASVRVQGREFALVERAEQDRLLAGWGHVLAGFCRERGAVARVGWSEWAAPAGLDEHLRYVEAEANAPQDSPHRAAYLSLLEAAGPMTTTHEVLVTVTVDARRIPAPRRRPGEHPDAPFTDVLLEELRLLSGRLEDAGLTVEPPLSPGELREVLRLRLDPGAMPRLASLRRAQAFAGVGAHNFGPLALDVGFAHARADGSLHRTYWVAEWPRLELPPAWMEPLILFAGGLRTLSLICEPVAPSRAQRRVDRDATKLASDEEQRTKRGFRIGARHRRAEVAVLEREQELVSGYAELEFAGFVTVTATTHDDLERSCAEYEQAAAQAGLELRPLDGQHDLG